jgi:copper transport protein
VRRLWPAVAVVVMAVAGWAAPAFAHAVLQSTNPPAGAVLSTSPGSAVMHFGEDVEVSFGAVRVFDAAGHRVDQGNAYHPHGDGHAVAVNMPGDLRAGGYVVTWRVISADSHPVHGAFTFQIGAGGATAAAASTAEAAKLLAVGAGSRTVGVLFGVIRFLAFGSLFVLVGGAAFVFGVWPDGRRDRRARRVLWAALIASVLTTALAIAIQAPYGGGLPLSQMVKPSAVNEVLHTRFGVIYLARLAVVVMGATPLLRVLLAGDRKPPRWWPPAAAMAGAAILITPGLAGHAGTGMLIGLAIPFDLLHVAAAAVWVGGLVLLAVAALAPRPNEQEPSLRPMVARYSHWALGAVVVIAITGGFAAWRQVGTWSAVTSTTFGRLLLAKTIIFAVLVILASLSRRLVHGDLALPFGAGRSRRPRAAAQTAGNLSPGPGATATGGHGTRRRPPPGHRRPRRQVTLPWPVRLRRAVLGEVILAAGIIAVTATLVNAQPARTAVALPYAAEVHAGPGVLVDVIVDPTRAGPVSIHLYTLSPAGAQIDVPEVDATFSLPSAGIDDLTVPLQKAGPGHYLAYDFDIPLRGAWKLQMDVRTTDIDKFAAAPVTVHIH